MPALQWNTIGVQTEENNIVDVGGSTAAAAGGGQAKQQQDAQELAAQMDDLNKMMRRLTYRNKMLAKMFKLIGRPTAEALLS